MILTAGTDGTTAEMREAMRLAELESDLHALPAFQAEAFDNEGDDEVIAVGADADAAGLACDRILQRYAGHLINRYIRARYPLTGQFWPISQQIDAVEELIRKFTSRAGNANSTGAIFPSVPTGSPATGRGAAGGCASISEAA